MGAKIRILAKKGGKKPKICQKLNQLGIGSNSQGKLKPINNQSWWKKITPPKPKSDLLAKEVEGGGGNKPKISQKPNQLGFSSNFQGKLKPINDKKLGEKIVYPT